MADSKETTLTLSKMALSRLTWLCDARVHSLRKFAAEHANDPDAENDVSDADNDATYYAGLAAMLRNARDG